MTANEVNALKGAYPIARPMFFYTDGQPKGAAATYLNFVISAEGKKIVKKEGVVTPHCVTSIFVLTVRPFQQIDSATVFMLPFVVTFQLRMNQTPPFTIESPLEEILR